MEYGHQSCTWPLTYSIISPNRIIISIMEGMEGKGYVKQMCNGLSETWQGDILCGSDGTDIIQHGFRAWTTTTPVMDQWHGGPHSGTTNGFQTTATRDTFHDLIVTHGAIRTATTTIIVTSTAGISTTIGWSAGPWTILHTFGFILSFAAAPAWSTIVTTDA